MNTLEPKRHFYAYTQDSALVLQFILSDFISTHTFMKQVEEVLRTSRPPFQSNESVLRSFEAYLRLLIGEASFPQSQLPFQTPRGPLTKLKEHCENLIKNTQFSAPPSLRLHAEVHQTWLHARTQQELIASFHVKGSKLNQPYLESQSIRALSRMVSRFNNIARYLPRVVNSFFENENIGLYLFLHREQLTEIYGTEELSKRFHVFSRAHIVLQRLIGCFTERGFEHILTKLQPLPV